MTACLLCHQEVPPAESRTIPANGHDLLIHSSCFGDFSAMVMAASRVSGFQTTATGLDRLVRTIDGQPVLVYRSFPNEQMPFLVFLAAQKDPVIVADMYKWAMKNEVRVLNPANQVQRLRNKNLITTFDRNGQRYAVITEGGRKVIEDYSESLPDKASD